jgi:hypothetical protein
VFALSPGQNSRSMRRGGSSNRRLQGWSRECETQLECLKTIINLTIDFLTHNQDVARTIPARMKGRRSSAVGAARTAGTAAAERNRVAVRTGTPSASAAPAGCNGGGRPRTAAAVDIAAGGGGGRPARTRPSGNLQARRQKPHETEIISMQRTYSNLQSVFAAGRGSTRERRI